MKTCKCLFENGQWPAASTVPKPQSDALPTGFQASASESAAFAAFQATADELKLLWTQAKKSITGSGVGVPDIVYISNATCLNCGQKGHTRMQCLSKPI